MTAATPGIEGAAVAGPEFRRFMRSWPTGVAVVTSADGQAPVGCTVNAFVSVSLRPPLILISLALTSRTLAAIGAAGAFGVNVLARTQPGLARHFATSGDDRFTGLSYRWEYGVPLLAEATATAVCVLERTITVADHALVLGSPRWCACDHGRDPLVFAAGAYQAAIPVTG